MLYISNIFAFCCWDLLPSFVGTDAWRPAVCIGCCGDVDAWAICCVGAVDGINDDDNNGGAWVCNSENHHHHLISSWRQPFNWWAISTNKWPPLSSVKLIAALSVSTSDVMSSFILSIQHSLDLPLLTNNYCTSNWKLWLCIYIFVPKETNSRHCKIKEYKLILCLIDKAQPSVHNKTTHTFPELA